MSFRTAQSSRDPLAFFDLVYWLMHGPLDINIVSWTYGVTIGKEGRKVTLITNPTITDDQLLVSADNDVNK